MKYHLLSSSSSRTTFGNILAYLCLMIVTTAIPAFAAVPTDRAAIAMRLTRWAEAFNARNPKATCDLFANDLVATVRGAPERGRDAVCAQLAAAMARRDRQLRYTPDIREIFVCRDLAVVRIGWTLEMHSALKRETTHESGIDIFRKQPGGQWSIIRFLSY